MTGMCQLLPGQGKIEAVGERCVLIRLGDKADLQTNQVVQAVTAQVERSGIAGIVEVVPSFTSVAVHFDPMAFDADGDPPTVLLARLLQRALQQDIPLAEDTGRVIEVPACYGGEFGPDLEEVAAHCGLTCDEVVALHCNSPLRVYTFYFAPGNPFSGPLDPRLNIGRRKSPRIKVEVGSVAVANGLSSIYAATSPGGWNVIARTPWNLFDLRSDPPNRLRLGDRLKFKPISAEQYRQLLEPR